jgi:hypothetical protein
LGKRDVWRLRKVQLQEKKWEKPERKMEYIFVLYKNKAKKKREKEKKRGKVSGRE